MENLRQLIVPSDLNKLVLATHWPSKQTDPRAHQRGKMQPDKLLLSIQACPGVHDKCAGMIENNKWECLLLILDASIVAVLEKKL